MSEFVVMLIIIIILGIVIFFINRGFRGKAEHVEEPTEVIDFDTNDGKDKKEGLNQFQRTGNSDIQMKEREILDDKYRPKWEYCVIGPFKYGLQPLGPKFSVHFIKTKTISEFMYEEHELPKILKLIVQEGWELTCAGGVEVTENNLSYLARGPGGGLQAHMLYFKRRIG